MAILQSCCCWQSLRKGSYASALYVMSYFSLNFIIMGITVHHDLDYYVKRNYNMTASVKPKISSFLEPIEISLPTMIYYLISLTLSLLGIIFSIILMIGLYYEIHCLLIPWMVLVTATSIVDISHSIYWLTLDDPSFNPLTAILFTIELFVIVLNTYATICVLSQYQEYKAGRGTAAYDILLETIRRQDQMSSNSKMTGLNVTQQPTTATTTGTSFLGTTKSTLTTEPSDCNIIQNSDSTSLMDHANKLKKVSFIAEETTTSSSNEDVQQEIMSIDVDETNVDTDRRKSSTLFHEVTR